jgi:aminopeptidase-like protein
MKNLNFKRESIGKDIYTLAKVLWPINRSITGDGVRKTLKILKKICQKITINEVISGKKVFDWVVPDEWNIKEAWIKEPNGKKIVDFSKNNLHVMGYSTPVNKKLNLNELKKYLYTLPNQPKAIPYVTSYYKKRWGFCMSDNLKKKLKSGTYRAYINSTLTKGHLTYGEIILPGETKKEIFLSTNICHPSLANNELSGPVVTIYLAKWLQSLQKRKFTYRIVFVPETIGSITYLSKNYKKMKKNIYAGFNICCIGDDRDYSYLPSRKSDTISDKVSKHVLKWTDKNYKTYNWSDRGSDERQYCSPGIDLPVASIMRTKYGEYPEYHTSQDDLKKVVTPKGLEGGYNILRRSLEVLENNCFPKTNMLAEPQLSKRNLYPTISIKNSTKNLKLMMDLISHSDGKCSLLDIANKINVPIWSLYPLLKILKEKKVLKIKNFY